MSTKEELQLQDDKRIFQREVDRLTGQEAVSDKELFAAEVARIQDRQLFQTEVERIEGQEGPGLVSRLLDFVNKPRSEEFLSSLQAGENPLASSELGAVRRAGLLKGAILEPAEALFQIPGVLGLSFGEKTADFFKRAQIGMHSKAEKAALDAGITEGEIGKAYAVGDFIGFIAPISASLKASSILLRTAKATKVGTKTTEVLGKVGAAIPKAAEVRIVTGNIVTDSTAGAIFGGLLRPGEDAEDRLKHLARESAAFGVARIILNVGIQPLVAFRRNAAEISGRQQAVEEIISKWENGESVVLKTSEDGAAISKILSEESYVTNSTAAQDLIMQTQNKSALIQGIVDAGASGSGIIKGFTGPFSANISKNPILAKAKSQFPTLKFDVVKAADGTSTLRFGSKGLTSMQRAQFKREGRFIGQVVEKGGAQYSYVRVGSKDGTIVVRRLTDNKAVTLKDQDIVDHLTIRETINAEGPAEALYKDFSKQLEEGTLHARDATGGSLPESELIKSLRDGTTKFDPNVRRGFDIGGAVIHPEELGVSQEFLTAQAAGLTEDVARAGIAAGNLLPNPRVISFEELVNAWAARNKLPANAPDFSSLTRYFAQRSRQDFWASIPKAEMGVLDALRNEQHAMVEAGRLPLEVIAHNQGMAITRNAKTGQVTMKDILTGRRVEFGSEKVARDALKGVIRPEGDVLGGSLIPADNAGVGGFTGGFRASDGVFTFDGKVPTREFIDDVPLFTGIRNVRDVFIDIEAGTKSPIFSKVFDKLGTQTTANRNFIEPWALKAQGIWKGVSQEERFQVAEFWRSLEGQNLSIKEATALGKKAGLNKGQLRGFRESRKIFDVLGEMIGLKDNNQWIQGYYGRLRPYAERTGGTTKMMFEDIYGNEANVPSYFKEFMTEHRVGDMAVVEMDPEIVLHKYIRTLGFKLHLKESYNEALALVKEGTTPRIRDLPPDQAKQLLKSARTKGVEADLDTPILPPPVRKMLQEFLNIMRGSPVTSQKTGRRFAKNFLGKLGVQADERVIEEYVNISLSMMYGSAMGLRPALIARNASQVIWMSYTRLGAKFGGSSLGKANSQAGWQEVVDEGVLRNVSAGIPMGDAALRSIGDLMPITGSGIMGKALAGTMRLGLRTGNVLRSTSRKFLIPYADQDDLNRAWSYFWQKEATADALGKYEAGKISWDKFTEEGLPFFHKVIREEFGQRYNKFGKENALRWIGKQGADETQFIYGTGAQPAWMQRAVGRLAGMFGTWPIWAFETYFNRSRYATPKQSALLWARTLALTGAFANMSMQSGISMWSWIAPASSFGWTGGPAVDDVIQLIRVWNAPLDQKADALKTLGRQVGGLSLPGQGFYRDLRRSLKADSPRAGALMMILGKPIDDFNFATEILYNADFDTPLSPEGLEGLRALNGALDFPDIPIQDFMSPVSRSSDMAFVTGFRPRVTTRFNPSPIPSPSPSLEVPSTVRIAPRAGTISGSGPINAPPPIAAPLPVSRAPAVKVSPRAGNINTGPASVGSLVGRATSSPESIPTRPISARPTGPLPGGTLPSAREIRSPLADQLIRRGVGPITSDATNIVEIARRVKVSDSKSPSSIVADSASVGKDSRSVQPSPAFTEAVRDEDPESVEAFDDIIGTGTVRMHSNGYLVYDSDRVGKDGKVPTHRLDMIKEILPPDTTIDQYEERVLSDKGRISSNSGRVQRKLALLTPDAQRKVKQLLDAAKTEGIKLEVRETFRSQNRQEMLFRQGRSDPGNIITWTLTSNHALRRAIDFFVNDDPTGSDPGYKWLEKKATELGMAPFGPGDPGHVFIPPTENK